MGSHAKVSGGRVKTMVVLASEFDHLLLCDHVRQPSRDVRARMYVDRTADTARQISTLPGVQQVPSSLRQILGVICLTFADTVSDSA